MLLTWELPRKGVKFILSGSQVFSRELDHWLRLDSDLPNNVSLANTLVSLKPQFAHMASGGKVVWCLTGCGKSVTELWPYDQEYVFLVTIFHLVRHLQVFFYPSGSLQVEGRKLQVVLFDDKIPTFWSLRRCFLWLKKKIFFFESVLELLYRSLKKAFCHKSLCELTCVNMQVGSLKKRVLFTDQCGVFSGPLHSVISCQSLGAVIISLWICILRYKEVIVHGCQHLFN